MNNEPSSQAPVTPQAPTPTPTPTPAPNPVPIQPQPTKKPIYKQPWFIILVCVLVLPLIIIPLVMWVMSSFSSPTATLFYDMLATTGQKNMVRLHAYEASYESEADLGKKPYLESLALTEYDYKTKAFTNVSIYQSRLSAGAGKCIKGEEFRTKTSSLDIDTFDQALAAVNDTEPAGEYARFYTNCDRKRNQRAKITDGIIPVGASKQQLDDMIADMKQNAYVTLKDEGEAEFHGKKGRKISVSVGLTESTKGYESNAFYFSFRDGTTGKVGGNGVNTDIVEDQFDTVYIQRSPSGALKGFYIIDEKTKLPIYSEFSTVNNGKEGFAPLVRKHHYEFPTSFGVDATTKLEKL
ncbi:MAG TPA: hypothetical protein VFZ48_05395 [Candidatus Saccharimonadales bacterium]